MRGRLLCLAALFAAGCLPELPQRDPYLLKAPPKPEGIRELPHSFALELAGSRVGRSLTMEVLNTGEVRVRGEAVSALKSYQKEIRMAAPAFLIRHSKEGLILVGTGLGKDPARRPAKDIENVVRYLASIDYGFKYRYRGKNDLLKRLARSGVAPEDIKRVIIPYWAPETIGNIDAFPNAEVLVDRREWEWKAGDSGPLSPAAYSEKINEKLIDLHLEKSFGAFENGHDLLGDGSVVLVSLPGRSPGNMGVWLNLDSGPVLLAGGSAFVVDNFLDFALPVKGKIDDLKDFWLSLHVIRKMAEALPQLLVVPGNDLTPLSLMKRSDISGDLKNPK